MYPRTVTTIKHNNAMLSVQERGRTYLLGFTQRHDAVKTRRAININKLDIEIHRRMYEDVSKDVLEGLSRFNINNIVIPSLTVDVEAKLIVPIGKPTDNYLTCNFDDVSTEDFMHMPFSRNIGVAFIMEESFESDDSKLVFHTHVIDPCENLEFFKNSLRL